MGNSLVNIRGTKDDCITYPEVPALQKVCLPTRPTSGLHTRGLQMAFPGFSLARESAYFSPPSA